MKPGYEPRDYNEARGQLVEEAGELVSALGKMLRFGEASYNPELPEDEQETNIQAVLREARDVKRAIRNFSKWVDATNIAHTKRTTFRRDGQ